MAQRLIVEIDLVCVLGTHLHTCDMSLSSVQTFPPGRLHLLPFTIWQSQASDTMNLSRPYYSIPPTGIMFLQNPPITNECLFSASLTGTAGSEKRLTVSVLPATAKICGAGVLTLNEYRSTPGGARNNGSGHSERQRRGLRKSCWRTVPSSETVMNRNGEFSVAIFLVRSRWHFSTLTLYISPCLLTPSNG